MRSSRATITRTSGARDEHQNCWNVVDCRGREPAARGLRRRRGGGGDGAAGRASAPTPTPTPARHRRRPRPLHANSDADADAPNAAPTVSAGTAPSVTMPTDTITLTGTASDDGLPSGSSISYTWSLAAGPNSADGGTWSDHRDTDCGLDFGAPDRRCRFVHLQPQGKRWRTRSDCECDRDAGPESGRVSRRNHRNRKRMDDLDHRRRRSRRNEAAGRNDLFHGTRRGAHRSGLHHLQAASSFTHGAIRLRSSR